MQLQPARVAFRSVMSRVRHRSRMDHAWPPASLCERSLVAQPTSRHTTDHRRNDHSCHHHYLGRFDDDYSPLRTDGRTHIARIDSSISRCRHFWHHSNHNRRATHRCDRIAGQLPPFDSILLRLDYCEFRHFRPRSTEQDHPCILFFFTYCPLDCDGNLAHLDGYAASFT